MTTALTKTYIITTTKDKENSTVEDVSQNSTTPKANQLQTTTAIVPTTAAELVTRLLLPSTTITTEITTAKILLASTPKEPNDKSREETRLPSKTTKGLTKKI